MPAALAILAAAAGCNAVSIDGEYLPACVAFAGDRIVIDGDTYTWERFTDMREVDAAGNVQDPFPDYPIEGTILADGPELSFVDADGAVVGTWYVHRVSGKTLLLDPGQHARVVAEGEWPDCPLELGAAN